MHPIRILMPRERGLYRDHLLRLDRDARRMRFGHPLDDDAVAAHVDGLSHFRDVILAHFDEDLSVIGAAHVALCGPDGAIAECAFSVDAAHRGHGIGSSLFVKAANFARNRGAGSLLTYCLAENGGMHRLARQAGMTIEANAGDAEAALDLPPANAGSLLSEMVSEHAGLCDYALKANRRTVLVWWQGLRRAA